MITYSNIQKRLTIVIVLLLSAWASHAQVTTRGTEFYFSALPNFQRDSSLSLYVIAIAEQNGTMIVETPYTGWADTVAIISESQNLYHLPREQAFWSLEVPNGIHVSSSVPISLYACCCSIDSAAMDVALIYPIEALGRHYRYVGYHQPGIMNVDGCLCLTTEDTTHVTISLRIGYRGSDTLEWRGETTSSFWERGQFNYCFMSEYGSSEHSGTWVDADKDIAVFSGSPSTTVFYDSIRISDDWVRESPLSRDHVYTQTLPTSAWGSEYVAISSMDGRSDNVRLITDSPGTTLITITDETMTQISVTQTIQSKPYLYFMTNSSPALVIRASNPIACVQTHPSRLLGDDTSVWGDASATILLPTNNFVQYARIPYFPMESVNDCPPRYFINVVTHAEDTASILLDGVPLYGFTVIGSTGYAYRRQEVSAAEHVLASCSSGGFGGHFYGSSLGSGYSSVFGGVRDTNVLAGDTVELTLSGCDTVWYGHTAYTQSGDYLTADSSCALYRLLHVTVGHSYRMQDTVELTNQDYLWRDGNTYTQSTDTTLAFTKRDGCDSILVLNLTIHHVDTVESDTAHCGPLSYNGNIYSTSGDVVEVVSNGDDITYYILHITIHPTYDIIQHYELFNDSLLWVDGQWYSHSTNEPSMTFITADGCDSIVRLDLEVYNDCFLWVPNVFTPNLSENNRFMAEGFGTNQFEIWIYNRRGALVWHSNNISMGWDGTHDGTPLPTETYTYIIRYTCRQTPKSKQSKVGTVTLIR